MWEGGALSFNILTLNDVLFLIFAVALVTLIILLRNKRRGGVGDFDVLMSGDEKRKRFNAVRFAEGV